MYKCLFDEESCNVKADAGDRQRRRKIFVLSTFRLRSKAEGPNLACWWRSNVLLPIPFSDSSCAV